MNARDKRGVFAVPRGAVTATSAPPTPTIRAGRLSVDHAGRRGLSARRGQTRPLNVDPRWYRDDIVGAWAGLRPLLHQDGKKPSELSRKDEIMVGAGGLISIAGGKLTTFRRMSERVVDLACERLPVRSGQAPPRKGTSADALLGSGDTGDDVAAFATRLRMRWPRVASDVVERLVALYGSNAERLVDGIAADPQLAERLAPHLPVTRAEVEYTVREEMAVTLDDFMERRSRLLLWEPDNGLSALAGVASAMGAVLDWDAARIRDEGARYRALVERLKSFGGEGAEVAAAQAAHG